METTGLSPRYDRVVSIALVLTDPWGRVQQEWTTLVNPLGPVGATHIHGITDDDVAGAPTFAQLAPSVLGLLQRRALVAHNATFDLAFLSGELDRAGWAWPDDVPSLCTLEESMYFQPHLDRRRLADCCWAAGVTLTDAHSALGDARAAAQLFSSFVLSTPAAPTARGYDKILYRANATTWPTRPGTPGRETPPLTTTPTRSGRDLTERARKVIAAKPTVRPRLLESFTLSDALDDGAAPASLPYLELLAEALEDGELSRDERAALGDLIEQYGLTATEVAAAHRGFIRALAREAVEDGVISHAERDELRATAALMDVNERDLNDLLSGQEEQRLLELSAALAPLPPGWSLGEPLRVGQRVVFTGCEAFGRDALEKRTVEAGIRVSSSVSRRTSVLVSDATINGNKDRAAAQLGIRTVHPREYTTLLRHRQPQQPASPPKAARTTTATSAPAGLSQVATTSTTTTTAPARPAPGIVRTWALAKGYDVGTRGRIHADVWDAYAAAHPPVSE